MEENKNDKRRKLVRNSTAEFLMFQLDNKEQGVEVYYKDETIWCTQRAMAELFDCTTDNVGSHLKNIFADGELNKDSTTEKFSVVQPDVHWLDPAELPRKHAAALIGPNSKLFGSKLHTTILKGSDNLRALFLA